MSNTSFVITSNDLLVIMTVTSLTTVLVGATAYLALSQGVVSAAAFIALFPLSDKMLCPLERPLATRLHTIKHKVFKTVHEDHVVPYLMFAKTTNVVTSCFLSYYINAPLLSFGQKVLSSVVTLAPKALDLSGLFPAAAYTGAIGISAVILTVGLLGAAVLLHSQNPNFRSTGPANSWRGVLRSVSNWGRT